MFLEIPGNRRARGAVLPVEGSLTTKRARTKAARTKAKSKAGQAVQGAFGFMSWGGARKGAGRKPMGAKPLVPHEVREGVKARHPLLVTTRVVPGLPSLRRHGFWRVVQRCLERACERFGVGIVHFSVQTNHLHLLVEAPDAVALARSMKGLGVRVARAVNKRAGRKGRAIADRYHHRLLRTPLEVRHALSYVLDNPPVAGARSWLLREGWRRHGLTGVDGTPGPRAPRSGSRAGASQSG